MRDAIAAQRRRVVVAQGATPSRNAPLGPAADRVGAHWFDDARLDTLFLASPVSWQGTLVQYAGRLNRSHASKTEVRVHDDRDARVPVVARMSERRLRDFRALGYEPRS